MGNSEVGHLTIGAGRHLRQDLVRLSDAVADGSFADNPALVAAVRRARDRRRPAALHGPRLRRRRALARRPPAGADRASRAARASSRTCMRSPTAATSRRTRRPGCWRSWRRSGPMARRGSPPSAAASTRWTATVAGSAPSATTGPSSTASARRAERASAAVEASYAAGVTDEFVEPAVIDRDGLIRAGDELVFCNFRPDRARQVCGAAGRPGVRRLRPRPGAAAADADHDDDATGRASPAPSRSRPSGRTRCWPTRWTGAGIRQLHAAETEKYPHVTYFLNGGNEHEHAGEVRIMVPSPRDVKTYDLKPEMSAAELAERAAEAIAVGRLRLRGDQLREPRHGRPHRRHPGRRAGGGGGRRGARPGAGGGRAGGRRRARHGRPRQRRGAAHRGRPAAHRAHHESGAARGHRSLPAAARRGRPERSRADHPRRCSAYPCRRR